MSGNKATVLVTGGLGNLGSWVTDHLASQPGYDVTVLAAKDRRLKISHPFKKVFCDITDVKALKECLSGLSFDYIIHLASVNDGFVEDYPGLSLRVNAGGTRNLLEIAARMAIKKFIYISTFHVYGKQEGTLIETDPVLPLSDYAITHYFAECYTRMIGEKDGLSWITLRLSNSYGCPKDSNSSKWYLLFNDLCWQAMKNKKIELKTNGKMVRDFIAMGDVCEAIQKLMEKPGLKNELFNLGSGKALTLLDVADEIAAAYLEIFGKHIPVSINLADAKEYPANFVLSIEKLVNTISFQPRIRFQEEAINIFRMLS